MFTASFPKIYNFTKKKKQLTFDWLLISLILICLILIQKSHNFYLYFVLFSTLTVHTDNNPKFSGVYVDIKQLKPFV